MLGKVFIKELKYAGRLIRQILSLKSVKVIIVCAIVIFVAPVVFFVVKRPQVQKDINYGITFSNKYAQELGLDWKETYLEILDDLRVKNLRLIAYWDDIEKVEGTYDFSDIKWQLEEARTRNIPVILSVGRKVPRYPECFEPVWWKETEDEKLRNEALYKYVGVAVDELKEYENIRLWQIENEPFFPFGECEHKIKWSAVREEVKIAREHDPRPILIQDSGEGGFWYPSYDLGDYLAISMYRKIWYDFWGALFGHFIYFQYPLAHWSYKIKADLTGVPYQKILVTELQAEPWGPAINSSLTDEEKDKTMSRNDFLATLSYAQKAGFKDLYLWGAEWWLWEKQINNNSFYWDTAKALFQ